ncbi:MULTISPECIES: ribosome hibernation-promoting factor, HPF/YfiA family [Vibrio]|uniref:Ribosome-associated translation inhibitor RaiA n=1 Tax=Vibrio algicola TaxID=2662262 RepID=A0A5Q0TKB0_9VIBR|nr:MULTISPECIES: ribosome-associated translation inhibitor RaiA [Vibrio]MBD1575377.1 ribosome-associated translation inhibitor RaiA [Vibrio sp. S11_S32]
MQMNVIGKNIEVTSSIRDHIEAKFKKLEKWQIELLSCHATISTEPANQTKIEAKITVPKGQLVASASDEDLYKAINEVEQKLGRQLNKLSHKPEAKRNQVLRGEEELEQEEAEA